MKNEKKGPLDGQVLLGSRALFEFGNGSSGSPWGGNPLQALLDSAMVFLLSRPVKQLLTMVVGWSCKEFIVSLHTPY